MGSTRKIFQQKTSYLSVHETTTAIRHEVKSHLRNTKHAVLVATIEAPDSSLLELHSPQAEMVPAMAASNLSHQQECLNTPSMMAPFPTDYGMLANTPATLDIINGTYVPPTSKYPSISSGTPRHDENTRLHL